MHALLCSVCGGVCIYVGLESRSSRPPEPLLTAYCVKIECGKMKFDFILITQIGVNEHIWKSTYIHERSSLYFLYIFGVHKGICSLSQPSPWSESSELHTAPGPPDAPEFTTCLCKAPTLIHLEWAVSLKSEF